MIYSGMSITTLEAEVLKLPPAAKASMISLLQESLEADAERELDQKWKEELDRRSDAFDRGELEAVDARQAIADLRANLRG